jgi:hypothetical protein
MVSNWTTCGKLQDAYQEWGFSTIINRAKSAPEVILGKWFAFFAFIKSEKINTCKQALAIVNSEKASSLF